MLTVTSFKNPNVHELTPSQISRSIIHYSVTIIYIADVMCLSRLELTAAWNVEVILRPF